MVPHFLKCFLFAVCLNGVTRQIPNPSKIYTLLQKYTQFCLFMMKNAYVLEGRNERGKKATPTSTSIFDFYGIKALLFEFGNAIFTLNLEVFNFTT